METDEPHPKQRAQAALMSASHPQKPTALAPSTPPPRQVVGPALDLLLALVANHPPSLAVALLLGLVPAVLRFTGPSHPPDLRLAATAFAGVLCRGSAQSVQMLVACQGVPFLMNLVEGDGAKVGGGIKVEVKAEVWMLGWGGG
jgi:hypothetical protein